MMINRFMLSVLSSVFAAFLWSAGFADEVERDRCSCKHVNIGAESTLSGGTCVRTEASWCLMEWGGQRTQAEESELEWYAEKAYMELSKGIDGPLEIPDLMDTGEYWTPTRIKVALSNLTRVEPNAYDQPGVVESFLLAAGTALARIGDLPLDALSSDLVLRHRDELVRALQEGGELFVDGPFSVSAEPGCLKISTQEGAVFVKTPFAEDARC